MKKLRMLFWQLYSDRLQYSSGSLKLTQNWKQKVGLKIQKLTVISKWKTH